MRTPSATSPRRWERRAEARPAELVDAALALFSERGFAATRLEDVAARAGVSKAAVYLYFQSKEHLFEAVLRQAVGPIAGRLEAMTDAFEGPTDALLRGLLGVLRVALDGDVPRVAKLVVSESRNFPALAKLYASMLIERAFPVVQRALARGVRRGELRPLDPAAVAPLVVAPVVMLAIWRETFAAHAPGAMDPDAVLAAHVETLLRGLAPHPRPERRSGKPRSTP